jgi:hypothetical protein
VLNLPSTASSFFHSLNVFEFTLARPDDESPVSDMVDWCDWHDSSPLGEKTRFFFHGITLLLAEAGATPPLVFPPPSARGFTDGDCRFWELLAVGDEDDKPLGGSLATL